MKSQYVLVTEFGDAHGELMYSHYTLLKQGNYQPVFLLNERLKPYIDAELLPYTHFFPHGKGQWDIVKQLFALIKKYQIELMIDNSAHSNYLRLFSLVTLGNRKLRIVGVCHYLLKFKKSFSQTMISWKVKKYLILNNLFKEGGKLPDKTSIKFQPFYPVYFPAYPAPARPFIKDENLVYITIAGSVNADRRDYQGLAEWLITQKSNIPDNIRFIILGNILNEEGKAFRQKVQDAGIETSFIFLEGFIDDPAFHDYLRKSDLIMPLVHPYILSHKEFLEGKISGAYNLAYAYHIPLLMYSDFSSFQDFTAISVFYNKENFISTLQKISSNKASLDENKKAYSDKMQFTLAEQAQKYLSFIEQ